MIRNNDNPTMAEDHSIYVHLPFCLAKCPYCDFNSTAAPSPNLLRYRDALLEEWHRLKHFVEAPPPSVYIGGGTPSIWPSEALVALLSALTWGRDAEITVEVNPGGLLPEWLEALHDAGVNRLSVGVQALDEHRLKQLGRRHTVQEAMGILKAARDIGFPSISGDIIYGTAGHTPNALARELAQLAATGVDHISAYELTIGSDTPLGRRRKAGEACTVDEAMAVRLWHTARRVLNSKKFALYEVSNYARNGRRSRHNGHYWRGGGYIGLGAGAHGFLKTGGRLIRYANTPDPEIYMAAHEIPASENELVGPHRTTEVLTPLDHAREQIMLGLRTVSGFSFESVAQAAPSTEVTRWRKVIENMISKGFLEKEGNHIVPTIEGLLRADAIAANFF